MVKEQTKKLLSGIAVAFLAGGLIGSLGFPKTETVTVEKIVNQTVEVPTEVIKEIEVEKEVIKEINVTKEVVVDNEKLDEVLEHLYDNEGKVEYLIDDLDDDEVEKIADRVVLINEFKKLAVDAIDAELFDELDNEEFDFNGTIVEFDEDDLERLRIDDEQDEILIDDIDFDDGDADLILTGTFDQDDERYDYEVKVVFKDFEFDELDDIKVTLHE